MQNPLNTIKNYMKQQGSPRDLLINFMTQNNQNPMINNLIGMAKNGNTAEVEKFARNIFKEQGKDFDKEFSAFMQNFKR
jgi:hypothetical protein